VAFRDVAGGEGLLDGRLEIEQPKRVGDVDRARPTLVAISSCVSLNSSASCR
jgi:hypothetical protein